MEAPKQYLNVEAEASNQLEGFITDPGRPVRRRWALTCAVTALVLMAVAFGNFGGAAALKASVNKASTALGKAFVGGHAPATQSLRPGIGHRHALAEKKYNIEVVHVFTRLDPKQIQQMSPLSDLSHDRDIYELASGELLFLMKGDTTPFLLEQEIEALLAIEEVGINVVPHRLVEVAHPVTGKIVRGLIEAQVSGEFVNIANDPEAAMKLVAQVSSSPLATLNLEQDIDVILNSFNSGFQVVDLQGLVQPDGHFVVINPGAYGVGDIFEDLDFGPTISQIKLPRLNWMALRGTTIGRLMKVQNDLGGLYRGRVYPTKK